jgi:hypothetical protein
MNIKNMAKKRIFIAKNLLDNSKHALLSAIEIHNKPIIPYRYEICTLLVVNARELIMKAYIYKFINKRKAIFKNGKDWMYVSFTECLNLISTNIGKPFYIYKESLEKIYEYRTKVAHSYWIECDSILYSLLSQNIVFYKNFYGDYFKKDLSKDNNLILLPIWFKKVISQIDFLSNISNYSTAPKEIQEFIKNIIISTKFLNNNDIQDPILNTYKMAFVNENNVKNADIVAKLDKNASISITKLHKNINLTDDPKATVMRFDTIEEEKKFQQQHYPLRYKEVLNLIKKEYPLKNRSGVIREMKKLKEEFWYACRWELIYQYKKEIIKKIGESFEDNPRLLDLLKK